MGDRSLRGPLGNAQGVQPRGRRIGYGNARGFKGGELHNLRRLTEGRPGRCDEKQA